MAKFSSDVDILKYEPILFGELHLSGQVMAQGIGGSISGTVVAASTAGYECLEACFGVSGFVKCVRDVGEQK